MIPNPQFNKLPKSFWAAVRSISQHCGYTQTGAIKIPTVEEMRAAYVTLGMNPGALDLPLTREASVGEILSRYFAERARMLTDEAEPALMNAEQARTEFERLRREFNPRCPLPMNKQKDAKRAEAFLTGIVNMLIDANRAEFSCDLDPRQLTSVTRDGMPVRTLARRLDGAFPSVINPVAVWEVKEYYYTKTFGSRVADGVYETLMDGMELEELNASEKIHIRHYLILDDEFTWWQCGRSYLCRIIDMLHMGYVDEVLFGREAVDRVPALVTEWVAAARRHSSAG